MISKGPWDTETFPTPPCYLGILAAFCPISTLDEAPSSLPSPVMMGIRRHCWAWWHALTGPDTGLCAPE